MPDDRTEAYAQAIVMIARGEDALDAVDEELLRVARGLADNPQLHEALTDGRLPIDRRIQVLDEVLPAAHPATRSALAMLVAAGRIRQLDAVAHRVAELTAAEGERELAEVRVAVPLNEEQRERLRRALERATGKRLELMVFVDPTVVGGVFAKVGDSVIDGSVARRLDDVRARLAI